MADTFYFASETDADELDFASFVVLLGIVADSSATFAPSPAGRLGPAWTLWQENWFSPVLAPAFVEVFHAASQHRINEIQSIDLSLDSRLSPSIARKSTHAAKAFLDGKSEMKGHREWIRFAEKVERGESPGHLCVLFALQSVLFHLPLAPALTSYAWFEFQSRNGKCPFPEMTEEENVIFSSVLARIPLAVQKNREDLNGGSSQLRVI